MDRPVKLPELPELPADLPAGLKDWCEAVEQRLRIMQGQVAKETNSRSVTIHDLVAAGLVADGVIK